MSQTGGRWDKSTVGRYFVGDLGRGFYTHVYAIAPKGGGCVKFGRASNVKSRFSGIQTGSPVKLELIGSIFVPAEVESYIHDHLKDHKSHGEWFYPTVMVMDIANLIAAGDACALAKEIGLYGLLSNRERDIEEFEERMTSGPRSL